MSGTLKESAFDALLIHLYKETDNPKIAYNIIRGIRKGDLNYVTQWGLGASMRRGMDVGQENGALVLYIGVEVMVGKHTEEYKYGWHQDGITTFGIAAKMGRFAAFGEYTQWGSGT